MCFRILMLSTCPVALSYIVVTVKWVKWLPMRCTVSPPVSAHYAGEVLTGQLSQLSKTQDHVHPARDSHLGTVSTRTPSTMCFCKREPAWFSNIWYTFGSCTWWQSTCIFASEARTYSLQFSRLDLYFSNHCTIHVHMLQLLFRFKAWASNWRTLGKCTRTSVKSTFLKGISVVPIEWRIKWAFCSSYQFDQDVKGQLEPMQQEYLRRRTPAACVLKFEQPFTPWDSWCLRGPCAISAFLSSSVSSSLDFFNGGTGCTGCTWTAQKQAGWMPISGSPVPTLGCSSSMFSTLCVNMQFQNIKGVIGALKGALNGVTNWS